jgi:putative Mn2+ efflux pump MntP
LSYTDIILLGLALGIDCLIASFSQGLIIEKKRIINSMKLALTMGIFQGLMPIIGYFVTSGIFYYVEKYSKWIVFGIFLILGLKFIFESTQTKNNTVTCGINIKCLFALGIGTSIDALASGINFKLIDVNLWYCITIIGLASFTMSLIGFWSGNRIKNIPNLEFLGGIILIWLAIKAIL